jgi:GDP-L-fucose synthase
VGVKKLLFLGSSCIYPKDAKVPIKESSLLTGPLEQSNEAYAVAKIAGIMMCKKYYEQYGDIFISAQPTNIYGIKDNFHPENSHLIPGIMRRMHEAKESGASEVVIWGSGKPMRELLYSEDLADALVYLLENYEENEIINVGTGEDLTIKEIAEAIKEAVGFEGKLAFDKTKPDGTFRKVMDVSRLKSAGWVPKTSLNEGLKKTYEYFLGSEI